MRIRAYQSEDCCFLVKLFFDTVHTVNAKDYTALQLAVWAPQRVDLRAWDLSFQKHLTLVAVENDMIVGFGDIDPTGYLDRLFVHRARQRQGIATILCDQLEGAVQAKKITTQASITAKPFFLNRGYQVLREQLIDREGVRLVNYLMEKQL